ncbi:hypothetical protein BGZ57DRAFT_777073, partial [Hyaloscypha finlandica]
IVVVITHYYTSTFNNLPGFEVTSPKFNIVNSKTIITNIIMPFFRKYSIKKVLSL